MEKNNMWNLNMKKVPMWEKVLLLSKLNKYNTRIVVIASLEEWKKGKRILVFPTGYVELLKEYGYTKGALSEFEGWAKFC